MIEKRKVGRPRKYGDEKLGKTYFVRLTDEQYTALKNAAAGAGVSVADYIRMMVDGEVMNTLMNGEKRKEPSLRELMTDYHSKAKELAEIIAAHNKEKKEN